VHTITRITGLLLIVIFFAHCGRKQRNVFNFPVKETAKINRLSLPAIRGLKVFKDKGGNTQLTWLAINDADLLLTNGKKPRLVGYHVYRLVKGHFVPKQPITPQPLEKPEYIDPLTRKNKKHRCYMIRGIFKIEGQIIQGPASQVVCAMPF
jgi:hypothetical protein